MEYYYTIQTYISQDKIIKSWEVYGGPFFCTHPVPVPNNQRTTEMLDGVPKKI